MFTTHNITVDTGIMEDIMDMDMVTTVMDMVITDMGMVMDMAMAIMGTMVMVDMDIIKTSKP